MLGRGTSYVRDYCNGKCTNDAIQSWKEPHFLRLCLDQQKKIGDILDSSKKSGMLVNEFQWYHT